VTGDRRGSALPPPPGSGPAPPADRPSPARALPTAMGNAQTANAVSQAGMGHLGSRGRHGSSGQSWQAWVIWAIAEGIGSLGNCGRHRQFGQSRKQRACGFLARRQRQGPNHCHRLGSGLATILGVLPRVKSLILKQKGLFLGPLALFEGGVANLRRIWRARRVAGRAGIPHCRIYPILLHLIKVQDIHYQ